jgi:hypothetical protein
LLNLPEPVEYLGRFGTFGRHSGYNSGYNWNRPVARPTSSGLPYLHRRADSGKYAYWRTLPDALFEHVTGAIKLMWAHRDYELAGNKVVKISLKTGDGATARERWGQIHSQVERFIKLAIGKARGDESNESNLKRVETLSSEEIATIAAQARHDILEGQDKGRIKPDDLSFIARAITQIRKADGKAFTDEEARRLERRIDQRNVAAMLESGEVSPLDASVKIYEGRWADEDSTAAAAPKIVFRDPGELTSRLQENGIDLVGPDVEHRKLALGVLRAKAGALRDADARDKGESIETPPRPAPIVDSPETDPEKKTLREMHDIWKDEKRPGPKAIGDNRLYIERFISLHGDLTMDQIKRKHIREFREKLRKVPRSMPNETAAKPLEEIVARGEKEGVKKFLGRGTINSKGIGSISTLFVTAIANTYAETNPCAGLRLEIKEGDKKKILPFSVEQLVLYFNSPSHQMPPKKALAGGGAAAFWMPLIALFEGAREEEIGQLLTADIKTSAWGCER